MVTPRVGVCIGGAGGQALVESGRAGVSATTKELEVPIPFVLDRRISTMPLTDLGRGGSSVLS